jgi:hypothetical protein
VELNLEASDSRGNLWGGVEGREDNRTPDITDAPSQSFSVNSIGIYIAPISQRFLVILIGDEIIGNWGRSKL